jgi:hypothetical protein
MNTSWFSTFKIYFGDHFSKTCDILNKAAVWQYQGGSMNTKVAKYFDNIKQNWFLLSTNEYMAVVWRFTVIPTHV